MPYSTAYRWDTGTSSTSTTSAWVTWNTSTMTTTSATTTWQGWNTNATTTSTSSWTSQDVWVEWVDGYGYRRRQRVDNSNYRFSHHTVPEPTPEELEAHRTRQEEYRQQQEIRDQARREADAKAEELLLSLLDDEQRAELEEHGQFHVIGSQSGKRYCIKRGYAGNIALVEEDGRRRKYCAHPRESLPTADHMVAQKLAIEAREDAFLAVANVS